MTAKHRVVVVMTHPVQYLSPWFRWMAAHAPDLHVTTLYAMNPSPSSQAAGFGGAFAWDDDLLAGHDARVLTPVTEAALGADHFSPVDAPNLEAALLEARPDAVLVPGWHAAVYQRAVAICQRHDIPMIYRGDTQLANAPSGIARIAWRAVTRRRLSRYAAWLAVGTRSREYLAAFGVPEPLTFPSPHAVDNDRFATPRERTAARVRFGLDPRRFTILFAGKLIEQKRPVDAVAAAARIAGSQLLVVGAGALEPACRAAAERLGVRATFAGFLNQRDMLEAYAACDCLVLPSESETWGLVVNEAMAAGRPAVVTTSVGCQPDLVHEDVTGAVAPTADVAGLTAALERVRLRLDSGHDFARACAAAAARHSYAAATAGLRDAMERLRRRRELAADNRTPATQVLACCGQMVIAGGLERMTFEVLSTLRDAGAGVHALVNRWESHRIVGLAEQAGVAWADYRCDEPLVRRPSLRKVLRIAGEVLHSSLDVLRHARSRRVTHVLVPDYLVAIRHWPALVLLRLTGRRVILRVGTIPPRSPFYGRLWRWGVNPAVDRLVCNSAYYRDELLAQGIAPGKVGMVRNTVSSRPSQSSRIPSARDPQRVIYVGQIIPDKGVDVLLDAVGRLRREGRSVTLDIVGDFDGWEPPAYAGHRARLRERMAQSDLRGAVRLLGPREDVPELMAEAAVHCLPSRLEMREGMASVVLEAKAAATPSVVSPHGSLRELVQHGVDGWIADDREDSLAEGLRRFLADAEVARAAGEAARESLQQFSQDRFADGWTQEFDLGSAAGASRIVVARTGHS